MYMSAWLNWNISVIIDGCPHSQVTMEYVLYACIVSYGNITILHMHYVFVKWMGLSIICNNYIHCI